MVGLQGMYYGVTVSTRITFYTRTNAAKFRSAKSLKNGRAKYQNQAKP